jgi:hypothetical protein
MRQFDVIHNLEVRAICTSTGQFSRLNTYLLLLFFPHDAASGFDGNAANQANPSPLLRCPPFVNIRPCEEASPLSISIYNISKGVFCFNDACGDSCLAIYLKEVPVVDGGIGFVAVLDWQKLRLHLIRESAFL